MKCHYNYLHVCYSPITCGVAIAACGNAFGHAGIMHYVCKLILAEAGAISLAQAQAEIDKAEEGRYTTEYYDR